MKRLVFLLVLLTSFQAEAAKPTKEQEHLCNALSSYVFPIGMNRAQGVPKERAWAKLVEQNKQISPTIEPSIRNLIDVLYSNQMTATDLFAITGEVYDECLKKVTQ